MSSDEVKSKVERVRGTAPSTRTARAATATLWLATLAVLASPAVGADRDAAWCAGAGSLLWLAVWPDRHRLARGLATFALVDAALIACAGVAALALAPWPEGHAEEIRRGLVIATNVALAGAVMTRVLVWMKRKSAAKEPIRWGAIAGLVTCTLAALALLGRDLIPLAG